MAGDINIGNPSVNVNVALYKSERATAEDSSPKGGEKQPSQFEQLKAMICAHQGEVAQGIYLSLEYHKRLRIASETGDQKAAVDAMHSIEYVSERHFREAWKATVKYLQGYFKHSRADFQFLPRICLKGTAADSHGQTIIDIYRGEDAVRSTRSYNVEANTAFAQVASKGRPYLCNDIPGAVCQGVYKNPRLDQAKAIHYCRDGFIQRFIRGKREKCDIWARCWIDYDTETSINCYRSTLVVPLTLLNNELDKDFVDSTIIGITRDAERTIYGFLCFDHPAIKYFRSDDVAVAYICADLLSFHLINRQALIHGSQTVEEFCETHTYSHGHRC